MIVLTGGTGFLGMELLVRLLEQSDEPITCLVRASDDAAAQARMDAVLDLLYPPEQQPDPGRVTAVAADLQRPQLGLARARWEALACEAAQVVHCAASVSFALPLPEARSINVDGTREVLALATRAQERGVLDRVVHVSTAYVAGERHDRVFEDEGDIGQAHRNTYEQTKLEAEKLFEWFGLPGCIVRPSIVVGDRRTGWTPAFNVIYWPLQAFARGLLTYVPANPDAKVDIVCVDAVADALATVTLGPRRSGRFHIVSGDDAPTCRDVAEAGAAQFDRPAPIFIDSGTDETADDRAGVFAPYFHVKCTFDDSAGSSLYPSQPPPIEAFGALLEYARAARWGKKPWSRWAWGDHVATTA